MSETLPDLRARLLDGEVIKVRFAEDLGFDVWVEKYANPPQVFFEGRPLPIERLDEVVERLDEYLTP